MSNLGLAVHEFVQRGNSFVNDGVYTSNKKIYISTGLCLWPFSKGKVSGGVKHSALLVNQGNLSTLQVGIIESLDLSASSWGLYYRRQMTCSKK